MTDGFRETAKKPLTGPSSSSIGQFSHSLAKISVAQILESADFCCSYRAPIETLAGIMVKYISHVGKLAVSHANSSNRVDCNVFDLIQALEEIESMHGFLGQSDLNRCLSNSSVIKDLHNFVNTKEIPFARSFPRFPIIKDFEIPRIEKPGNENPGNHIPNWLPAFPEAKMYENNEVFETKEERNKKKKQEREIFSLQKLFGTNGSDEMCTGMEPGTEKAKRVVPNNPFQVPPLPSGQIEVSKIGTMSERGKISLNDSLVPKIEEKYEVLEEERVKNEVCFIKPVIRFKINAGKKNVAKKMLLEDKIDENEDEIEVKKMRGEF